MITSPAVELAELRRRVYLLLFRWENVEGVLIHVSPRTASVVGRMCQELREAVGVTPPPDEEELPF
jgi:hypothetical protein